jgi:tetratricopeptide (TPR) repeat protein
VLRVTLGRVAIVLAAAAAVASIPFSNQDHAEAKINTFYAQVQGADFASARKSINEAVQLWPSNARYYIWRGYADSQELPSQCPTYGPSLSGKMLEDVREAAADYRRALDLNRRDAVAHHNLAWLDHLVGKNEEARQEWQQAVAIDPETATYHLSLGFFLDEAGEADEAKRQFVTAIELTPAILDSPFFTRLHNRDAGSAEAMVREATANLEGRLRAGDDPILKARLGKLWLYRGDARRAAELLNKASTDLPNLPLVWFNLGEARRLQRNRDEAWACYQKARFLDPGLAGPALRIGEMYREAGQRTPAVENLRSAAQRWAHVKPVTAAHNTRLYGGTPQPIDDLLPTTLVWYTSPCEASEAYAALAELFPENKIYASRVRTCETLPSPHAPE